MMPLEMETKTVTYDVDTELEGKLQQLQRDGWGIVPGIKPTTTYTICRARGSGGDGVGGQAQLIVDDAGVHIMPASAHKKKAN